MKGISHKTIVIFAIAIIIVRKILEEWKEFFRHSRTPVLHLVATQFKISPVKCSYRKFHIAIFTPNDIPIS